MTVTIKKKKRKAGERAGMSPDKIARGALQVFLNDGPNEFTIRAIAQYLNVGATTIHAHFKQGKRALLVAIVRVALEELTPPFKLKQDPTDYLRQFLKSTLSKFRKHRALGRLATLHLTDDPLLSPVFTAKLFQSIGTQDPAWAYRHLLTRLAGVILMETSDWSAIAPGAVEAQIKKATAAMSKTEFPALAEAAGSLAAHYHKRSTTAYLQQEDEKFIDAVIAELTNGAPSAVK